MLRSSAAKKFSDVADGSVTMGYLGGNVMVNAKLAAEVSLPNVNAELICNISQHRQLIHQSPSRQRRKPSVPTWIKLQSACHMHIDV